jgi:hypothetical protein
MYGKDLPIITSLTTRIVGKPTSLTTRIVGKPTTLDTSF